MGDSIKRSGGPGSSEDIASRPDVGFHDDHVGSGIKFEEAAKRRAALGVSQRRPKRIEAEPKQVQQVGRFRGTEDDKAARDAQRQQRALVRGKGPARAKPKQADVAMHAVDQDVRSIEERVDLLMTNLAQLELMDGADQQVHAAEETEGGVHTLLQEEGAAAGQRAVGTKAKLDASVLEQAEAGEEATKTHHRIVASQDEDEDAEGESAFALLQDEDEEAELGAEAAAEKWERTARDMRFLLQHLIAGGVGLSLAPDPAATFKHLFEGLKAWPAKVPPGHRPVTDADYDRFLAWVFRPEFGLEAADFGIDVDGEATRPGEPR